MKKNVIKTSIPSRFYIPFLKSYIWGWQTFLGFKTKSFRLHFTQIAVGISQSSYHKTEEECGLLQGRMKNNNEGE